MSPIAPDSDLAAFTAALPASGALIGLDLGTKTIGLALSDPGRRIATPLFTIARTKFTADAEQLRKTAEKHAAAGLVLGLPLNMDGSEGPRVQATRAFARNLMKLTALPILFWDERLSTAAVTRTLIDADTSRKRRGEVVDKMAAAYILQGALDRMAHRNAAPDEAFT
jgi:putative holliday junction resolvase